jgi:nucleotidyltransferase/DNA polymerase involved in DNA repair
MTIVCALYPRFELLAALGDRRVLLSEPAAVAPEAGREQVVGEVSAPAEAYGIVRGMRLGEAMSRCPELRLVAPDPEGVRSLWGAVLDRLEGIGAEVESDHAGAAFFAAAGLHGIHGGDLAGVLGAARRALGPGARFGVAPSRFSSHAAAQQVRPRRGRCSHVVAEAAVRDFLAPLPVALLRTRPELQALPEVLERLGIRTLGELAALPSSALADRFGPPGLQARELALGRDTDLRPRAPGERLVEEIELPDAVSGLQLQRALELLIDRLLARPERRERALRTLRLGARFVERGTWRREVPLRQASTSRERLRLSLMPRLDELPAPIEHLSLTVVAYGPPVADQLSFQRPDEQERRNRLTEALRQTRAAAGPESVLRVLEAEPDSRVPERRAFLTPFPE